MSMDRCTRREKIDKIQPLISAVKENNTVKHAHNKFTLIVNDIYIPPSEENNKFGYTELWLALEVC